MRKVLEAIALAALLAMFAMLALYSDIVPNRIPIHWDAAGAPDRWGSKETLWIFPMVGAAVYLGLSIVGFVRRKAEIVSQLMSAVKVVTMISFAVMSRQKLDAAMGHNPGFGGMLAIVMIVLMGAGLWYARRGQRQHES